MRRTIPGAGVHLGKRILAPQGHDRHVASREPSTKAAERLPSQRKPTTETRSVRRLRSECGDGLGDLPNRNEGILDVSFGPQKRDLLPATDDGASYPDLRSRLHWPHKRGADVMGDGGFLIG